MAHKGSGTQYRPERSLCPESPSLSGSMGRMRVRGDNTATELSFICICAAQERPNLKRYSGPVVEPESRPAITQNYRHHTLEQLTPIKLRCREALTDNSSCGRKPERPPAITI